MKWPEMGSKLFKGIIVVCLLVCVIVLLQLCSSEPTPVIEPIKQRIQEEKIDKDSIHERVVYKDRERIVYVTKWRTFKGRVDSIPCPEALNEAIILTDSIIVVDSSEISSLKAELFVSNLIIANQDTIIKKDSVVIVKLNKKLRRTRFIARICAIWGGVATGVAVLK